MSDLITQLTVNLCLKEEDVQSGDQDQEERKWNKRTQQMLHGLQVRMKFCLLFCEYIQSKMRHKLILY